MGNAMKVLLESMVGVTVYDARMRVMGRLAQLVVDGEDTVFVLDDGGDFYFEICSREFCVNAGSGVASIVLRDRGVSDGPLRVGIDALADAEMALMDAQRIAGWEYAIASTRQARLIAEAAERRGLSDIAGVIREMLAAAQVAQEYIESVMAVDDESGDLLSAADALGCPALVDIRHAA